MSLAKSAYYDLESASPGSSSPLVDRPQTTGYVPPESKELLEVAKKRLRRFRRTGISQYRQTPLPSDEFVEIYSAS